MVTQEINSLWKTSSTSFTRTVRPRMHFASLSSLKSEVSPLYTRTLPLINYFTIIDQHNSHDKYTHKKALKHTIGNLSTVILLDFFQQCEFYIRAKKAAFRKRSWF